MPRDLIDDAFVQFLRTAIGGWLSDDNVVVFEQAIKAMPEGGAVVEIGSFLGRSTTILSYALRKYARKNRFFNCDAWHYPQGFYWESAPQEILLSAELYEPWVRESYERNIRAFTLDPPHSLRLFSDQFFDLWDKNATATDLFGREIQLGGAISFAYIDGDHGYEATHKDFFNADRFLLPGGIVLLDDSSRASPYKGVHRVLDEIRATNRYDTFADRYNRAFIKRA